MRELEQESNIEVLRQFSGILLKTVDRLQPTVKQLTLDKMIYEGKEMPFMATQDCLSTELRDQLSRL